MNNFRFPPQAQGNPAVAQCTPNDGFLYASRKGTCIMYIPPKVTENPPSFKPIETPFV